MTAPTEPATRSRDDPVAADRVSARTEPAARSGARGTRRRVAGSPVDAVSLEAAVAFVAAALARRTACRIVVTNANKAWLAARDARLREILEGADLVVAEWATSWAARTLGVAGVEHVGGITLMVRLLAEAERSGWSCYFLGAAPGVAETLVARLRRERPALRIAGWHHGYLDEASRATVVAELVAKRPDLLFVAMGSPLQEYFLAGLPASAAGAGLGVGGSFDVLAGLKRDAPAWARGRGLEWLYRLSQDPRRLWRRYLVTNTWFVARVVRERLARRRAAPLAGAEGGGAAR
ncbi:MAG TPA: WecB/TagA/CpsF family glycosyltransferase [Longimicrobiales bacterium]|nr:WecB/TagA/CpsF family glycosyltransferase [Longimicrobiales bacterium]